MKKKPNNPARVSKAEQRVVIAKDALNQLKLEKYIAQTGRYTSPNLSRELEEKANGDERQQAKPFLLKTTVSCEVCAKGALFLSAIRKYNNATVNAVMCDNMRVAENIFGKKQFDMIEACFEQWDITVTGGDGTVGDPVPDNVQNFGLAYVKNNHRLQAILKNIIKNKGTFKP